LRDTENVPLKEDINEYFNRELIPHAADVWIDETKTAKGYEINFSRYFYRSKPLKTLGEIKADILALDQETEGLLKLIIS
jgi:type I restriction enzyme M protein